MGGGVVGGGGGEGGLGFTRPPVQWQNNQLADCGHPLEEAVNYILIIEELTLYTTQTAAKQIKGHLTNWNAG